jgi:uncharacterized membrane protein YedE/YeeE
MKYIKYCLIGILFGIVMTKSEVISWYRIQEMFRFQAFHMYGVIGSTVAIGVVVIQLIKRRQMRNIKGAPITFKAKDNGVVRYLYGGILFGLGWALSGACPGPMFTLVGAGFPVFVVVILSAVAGTYVYGLLRDKLPH